MRTRKDFQKKWVKIRSEKVESRLCWWQQLVVAKHCLLRSVTLLSRNWFALTWSWRWWQATWNNCNTTDHLCALKLRYECVLYIHTISKSNNDFLIHEKFTLIAAKRTWKLSTISTPSASWSFIYIHYIMSFFLPHCINLTSDKLLVNDRHVEVNEANEHTHTLYVMQMVSVTKQQSLGC